MNKHCVITGAADGIGKALALRFGAVGYCITGVDVDAAQAAQTEAEVQEAGAAARFLIADLTREAEVQRVASALTQLPPIDVLVHNAGISAVGHFGALSLARQQAVLHLNLRAPLLLSAALLRQERMARGGSLVFLASLSCFTGYPGAASYAASKDGLAAYARSLAAARRDLHVLTVYPGPTRTAHARRYSPDNRRESRRMPPEQLADAIYHAVQRRQRILIPGAGNRLFALLGHVAPRLTEWAMRKTVLEKV